VNTYKHGKAQNLAIKHPDFTRDLFEKSYIPTSKNDTKYYL
jgi:hypothetical protein